MMLRRDSIKVSWRLIGNLVLGVKTSKHQKEHTPLVVPPNTVSSPFKLDNIQINTQKSFFKWFCISMCCELCDRSFPIDRSIKSSGNYGKVVGQFIIMLNKAN